MEKRMEHSPDKKSFEEIKKQLLELSPEELLACLNEYDHHRKTELFSWVSLHQPETPQNHRDLLSAKTSCPYCGHSTNKRNGKSGGLQRYLCLNENCGKTYTFLTGTILDKSRWSWDFWVRLTQLVITSHTIKDCTEILKDEFACKTLSPRSIYLAKHKLLHAMRSMPQPVLEGTVQVDEIYLRENQKGTRTDLTDENGNQSFPLINVIPSFMDERVPRYSIQPSLLGVTSPEYVCTVLATDNSGHVVAFTTNLGKLSLEQFGAFFDPYLRKIDYLCSDSGTIYANYCRARGIPHYIRPVNLIPTLFKSGYDFSNGIMYSSPADHRVISSFLRSLKKEKLSSNYGVRLHTARPEHISIRMMPSKMSPRNREIASRLYHEKLLDYIDDDELLPFDEFCRVKDALGLNLARVNSMHDHFLVNLNVSNSGVATKHFPEYLGTFVYLHNWEVDHGHPPTSIADAEQILIELLAVRDFITLDKVNNRSFYVAPMPDEEYMNRLNQKSIAARKLLDNKFFKFDESDKVLDTNNKSFICSLPDSQLRFLAEECKIHHYSEIERSALQNILLNHPDIENAILRLTATLKVYDIYSEDSKYLLSHKLTPDDLTYSKNIRGTILENQSVLKSSVHGKVIRQRSTEKDNESKDT